MLRLRTPIVVKLENLSHESTPGMLSRPDKKTPKVELSGGAIDGANGDPFPIPDIVGLVVLRGSICEGRPYQNLGNVGIELCCLDTK